MSEATMPNGPINFEQIITGLANDLKALRRNEISIQQARASAELGKQIFAGARIMISARKMLEQEAVSAPNIGHEQ